MQTQRTKPNDHSRINNPGREGTRRLLLTVQARENLPGLTVGGRHIKVKAMVPHGVDGELKEIEVPEYQQGFFFQPGTHEVFLTKDEAADWNEEQLRGGHFTLLDPEGQKLPTRKDVITPTRLPSNTDMKNPEDRDALHDKMVEERDRAERLRNQLDDLSEESADHAKRATELEEALKAKDEAIAELTAKADAADERHAALEARLDKILAQLGETKTEAKSADAKTAPVAPAAEAPKAPKAK